MQQRSPQRSYGAEHSGAAVMQVHPEQIHVTATAPNILELR
jgi:hypothetical protein